MRLLNVALDRAKEASDRDAADDLNRSIKAFLDGEESPKADGETSAWDDVRQLTAAWLEELVERNLATQESLKRTLHWNARNGLSRQLADALFNIQGQKRQMTVTRTFRVPRAMASCVLAAIEVNVPQGSTVTVEPVFDVKDDGVAVARENELSVTVDVEASSRDLAVARASERAWDALKNVRLLAGASEMSPPRDDDAIAANDAAEVIADGKDEPAPEPFQSVTRLSLAPHFPRVHSAQLSVETLIRAEQHDISRTLHWLSAADQAGIGPAHRISNIWVAVEHIIVEEHDENNGSAVARTLADVGALCRIEALAGYVTRELCEALKHSRFHAMPPDVARSWESSILDHLGVEVLDVIHGRRKQPAPFTDAAALRLLLSAKTTDLNVLRDSLEEDTPIAAFAIRYFVRNILGNLSDLAAWLRTTRREIQSLALHAYEIRNLLFHNGKAFGFEDAARLHSLYVRFRLVVDAVVARFATRLIQVDRRDIAPGELWAMLRIGVRDLLIEADQDKNGATVNREMLRRAVLLTPG